MGLFTRDIKTMNDLFLHQLQDIYYAEKQLVKALPQNGRQGDRQAAQAGISHPSR
jgi:ferritin-like metal-binding protein YciE